MPIPAPWRRFFAVFSLILAASLAFSLSSPSIADGKMSLRQHKIHHGLKVAISKIGDPYVYGAEGPHAFDCSGLTMYSFGKAGIHLPRTAASQYGYVRHISKRHLHRGDLMFFHSGSSVYHVAIFLGRRHHHVWLLHAPHTGTVVQRDPVWTSQWWAGTLRHR
jgi:cell wall-associated NlpC family hydrolase